MQRLNQTVPVVEILIKESGEQIISASRELHLEDYLLDLRNGFAKVVQVHISRLTVSFREFVSVFSSSNGEIRKTGRDENGILQRGIYSKNADDEKNKHNS